tara:strand:- start:9003 stop:10130 length:1128 start_codon:yes stop_codon:yes gene_type:complete
MKYLINSPHISKLEKKYVLNALNSGWLSVNGKNTKEFEKKISKFLNINYSLAVQSGTAAIHLALKSLGCKSNQNVIVPNYTCVSNISAVSQCGAIPIIVEIERDTLGIDLKQLKIAIKKYKPKILQLVHVYGCPAKNTMEIVKICKKNKIKLIEDFSESLGAELGNKKIGNFGDISICSIRSEKMIGVGEGGVVLTKNKALFEKIKKLGSRNSPFRRSKDPYWKKYFSSGEGYNYLLPHLLGSMARAQIERFQKYLLPKKIKIGKLYKEIFDDKNISITQKPLKNSKPVYWLNSIYFKNLSKTKVRKIAVYLEKKGIEVRSGFWPLSNLKGFKSKYIGKKKVSMDIFNKSLVLPSNISLKKSDIKKFKSLINNFL